MTTLKTQTDDSYECNSLYEGEGYPNQQHPVENPGARKLDNNWTTTTPILTKSIEYPDPGVLQEGGQLLLIRRGT
jgi:hypothetical protein